MNILIVEDESLVRTSMARMIARLGPDHAVFEAEDGEEALRRLETEPFDLIVTDIRMPAVNGLELSKQVQERWPDTVVVMLTGHADFQYAQEAIRYNVKEYLLKPVSVEHLRRVVGQVEEELKRRKATEVVDKLRTRTLLEKRVQDLFYELPLPYFDESLFPPFARFAVFSFGVPAGGERGRTARFALKNVIEDLFSPYGTPVVVVSDQAVTAVLFLPAEAPASPNPTVLDATALYAAAAGAMASDAASPDAPLAALADPVLHAAKSILKLDASGAFCGVSAQLHDLKRLYLDGLASLGAAQEPEPAPPAEEQVHRIVRSALELIHEKFAEDLSLTSIADALYVSPNYLSSLFKSETGSTFTHHLTKARMNKAKQLLRETNLKIYEVCEQVGYADQTHFSRMFKALEGMSPYEYRTKANI